MPVSGVNQFHPPGLLHLFLHGYKPITTVSAAITAVSAAITALSSANTAVLAAITAVSAANRCIGGYNQTFRKETSARTTLSPPSLCSYLDPIL